MKSVMIVLASFFLLGASPAPPAAPDEPETPTPPHRAPHPPRDRMFFVSSGGSWLGVSIEDITSERAKKLDMREEAGVEVTAVVPDSPADEAGVQKKDVILEYQGTKVEGAVQLTRLVRETPAGRTVSVKLLRDGSPKTVHIKLAERDEGAHEGLWSQKIEIPPIEIPEIDIPDVPFVESIPSSSRLGVSIEDLGRQLGEYFGVKDGEGVLVRSVKKGTPADSAGLRAGDVIVKVDGEAVSDSGDLRSALRAHRGKSFPLTIVRDRRSQTVTVTLPKPEESQEESREESRYRGLIDEESIQKKMDAARAKLEAARALMEARMAVHDGI